MIIVAGYTLLYGLGPLLYIFDHWAELITASLIMSIAQVNLFFFIFFRLFSFINAILTCFYTFEFDQAFFVYAQSFQKDEMLALGGNTSSSLFNVCFSLPLSFFRKPSEWCFSL